jgi:hypothetical protein
MVVQVLCGGMSGDVWWGFKTQYAYDLFALFSGGITTFWFGVNGVELLLWGCEVWD